MTIYRALALANVGTRETAEEVRQRAKMVLKCLKHSGAVYDYMVYGEPSFQWLQMEICIVNMSSIHYMFDVRTLTEDFIPVAEVLWS